YTLNAEARQMVREFAATYRLNMQNPRASLAVKGHTSSSGPFAYNMALSQKRAQFTYEFLEAILGSGLKIPERNLLVRGYGESEALQTTGEDVESAYHRRVDMELNGTTLLAIGSSQ
ncbi:MAG: OmpA family protein, partial [Chloroflexi bacterium]|nr:OmpA family protein [Chloroflexota bacterium]